MTWAIKKDSMCSRNRTNRLPDDILRNSQVPVRELMQVERLESRRLLSTATRVVGYFPEYRYGLVNNVDLSAVTQVNYFDLLANNDGSLNTGNISLAHLDSMVTKVHNAHDTISITVGPQSFATVAGNSTSLNNLVTNLISFCAAHNLDGIDIDW